MTARQLWLIFGFALLLRLINLALLADHPAYFFDQLDAGRYWAIARELLESGRFDYDLGGRIEPVTDVMPFYPGLLAAVQWLAGDAPWLLVLIQSAMDGVTCVLIALLGAMLSPRVGLVAGLLAATSINLILSAAQVMTDTPFLLFFTLMLWAAARFLRAPHWHWALLAGLAGGLATATRPISLAFLLVAAVTVLVVMLVRRLGAGRALGATLAFALAAALPILPTVARNLDRFGTPAITSQGGHHMIYWVVPLTKQRLDGTPWKASVDEANRLYAQRLAELSLKNDDLHGFQYNGIKAQIAMEQLKQLPAGALALAWAEGIAVNLASPSIILDPRVRTLPKPSFYLTEGQGLGERVWTFVTSASPAYQAAFAVGLASSALFLLLEAAGFVLLARRNGWAAFFAAGVLGYFLLINGPVATPKYRLPMEPVLLVLSALALVEAWRWVRSRYGAGRHN